MSLSTLPESSAGKPMSRMQKGSETENAHLYRHCPGLPPGMPIWGLPLGTLVVGLLVIGHATSDFTYLVNGGWFIYFLPFVFALTHYVVLRLYELRRALLAAKQEPARRVTTFAALLVIMIAPVFAAPLAMGMLEATLIETIEVPRHELEIEQLPGLESDAQRRLGCRLICYWKHETVRVVFRNGPGQSTAVRNVITELLAKGP